MCFIFSGKNERLYRALYYLIAADEDRYFYYDDALLLLKDLTSRLVSADFLLLDYELYKGFSELIYDVLISKELKIPIIILGNPDFDKNARTQRWLSENEIRYDSYNMHTLVPTFIKINEALEHSSIRQLLSSCSTPKKEVHGKSVLDEFRHEKSMSPSLLNLLEFMYEGRRKDIPIESIALHLGVDDLSKKDSSNIVYAYISRLRKVLKNSLTAQKYALRITRTRKGFYRLFLT